MDFNGYRVFIFPPKWYKKAFFSQFYKYFYMKKCGSVNRCWPNDDPTVPRAQHHDEMSVNQIYFVQKLKMRDAEHHKTLSSVSCVLTEISLFLSIWQYSWKVDLVNRCWLNVDLCITRAQYHPNVSPTQILSLETQN